jgi:hypothetical protein
MPEGAIVTTGEDVELVLEIERGLKPGQSNFRVWLWLLVPGLMSPNDPVRPLAPALLPSMTKRFVAGRADLKVAVCILLPEWFGTIAILWWFGTINEVPGFVEAFPVAPSGMGRHLPDVPKRVVSPMMKRSWQRSSWLPTVMRSARRIPTGGWPHIPQSLQPPFGAVCQICQTFPSLPTAPPSCLPS